MADEAANMTKTMKWYRRGNADVEFLLESPAQMAEFESKHAANPNDPALEGRVRFKNTPKPPQPGSDLDIVGRFKQWATAPPPAGSQRTGGLGPAIRGLGDILLPGSIPAAAVMAAVPAAGRVGGLVTQGAEAAGAGPLLSRAAGAATKFLTPAAAGGATAAATGESVSEPIGGGLTASGLQAAFGATGSVIGAVAKRFANVQGSRFATIVRDQIGPKLAQAFNKELPTFKTGLKNVSDLLRLTREETGRGVLSTEFKTVEPQIEKTLSKAMIVVPEKAAVEGGQAAAVAERQIQGLPGMVPLSAGEALKAAKLLRDKGMQKAGGEGVAGLEARQLAEEVQGALERSLATRNQGLATRYTKLRDEYGKFMDLRDTLTEDTAKLFPALPKGGPTVDLVELRRRLINNPRISPERFPELTKFLGGGEAFGTGPTEAPGMFLPRVGHSVGGAYVGEPAKRMMRTELPAAYQPRGTAQAIATGAPKVGRAIGTAVGTAVAGPASSPPTPEDLMLEQLKAAP